MDISKFLNVYANLPIGIRSEIVVVMDDEGPMTWNAAYIEINAETELGRKIYDKLAGDGSYMTDSDYIDREFQKLVLARLRALPDDTSLSIGSKGSFRKSQLVEHVENNDDIGKQMIEIDRMYLQALKEGTLFER